MRDQHDASLDLERVVDDDDACGEIDGCSKGAAVNSSPDVETPAVKSSNLTKGAALSTNCIAALNVLLQVWAMLGEKLIDAPRAQP